MTRIVSSIVKMTIVLALTILFGLLNSCVEYTKYEKARIIGARALQISMGAPFLVKLTKEELEKLHFNPIQIAKLEFDKRVIPMSIKRTAADAS